MNQFLKTLSDIGSAFGRLVLSSLLPSLLLFFVCLLCIKLLLRLTNTLLLKSKLDKNMHSLVHSTVKVILISLFVLIMASSVGIDVTSLLAVLSIVGVAVSLAIQDVLSNFFSGIVLLGSKPFSIDDFVTIGGQSGSVIHIGITHTKLHTPDNQIILIPNSKVTSDVIINVTAEATRRLNLTFTASYNSSTELVEKALTEAADIPQVLRDQPVFVNVSKYNRASVEYVVRVWVKAEDYWDAHYAITERVRECYTKYGVEFSSTNLNVHNVS